ncbi:AraC family transcriptional regulator [Neptuniibacter sp. 2_MG-2023]|uniref:AraC family transcriptional regulator n=1 Tax=Neptuniibacter sp. 2_MG-2023 TaxID=3062671 RepID=UPI0026E400BF|nr:helix-turn-helix transcriptional regulator [Neptuniibacter sp. 2_MG-2023]MDO6513966.1 helix-turn-helix transcriptional regulator [Neptuniibacter sp. 2_MG-2023]
MKPIKQTSFENRELTALGIEPIRLEDMRDKLPAVAERLEFYILILVTAGSGKHSVDFVEYGLSTGSLLFVRPGQVQEWSDYAELDAEVVLIDPKSLPYGDNMYAADSSLLALDRWQNCTLLPSLLYDDLLAALLRLRRDFTAFNGSQLDIALVRHEVLSILLRLARWQDQLSSMVSLPSRSQKTYQLFIQLLEQQYTAQHSLNYYAQRLGYAQSTLSRACLKYEGVSAKVVIDRRIALEAQRILAHSRASVAEVGFYLGFSETTNFIKFFKRVLGTTPSVFQRNARGNHSPDPI